MMIAQIYLVKKNMHIIRGVSYVALHTWSKTLTLAPWSTKKITVSSCPFHDAQ